MHCTHPLVRALAGGALNPALFAWAGAIPRVGAAGGHSANASVFAGGLNSPRGPDGALDVAENSTSGTRSTVVDRLPSNHTTAQSGSQAFGMADEGMPQSVD